MRGTESNLRSYRDHIGQLLAVRAQYASMSVGGADECALLSGVTRCSRYSGVVILV